VAHFPPRPLFRLCPLFLSQAADTVGIAFFFFIHQLFPSPIMKFNLHEHDTDSPT
jgi:hypothetical protein